MDFFHSKSFSFQLAKVHKYRETLKLPFFFVLLCLQSLSIWTFIRILTFRATNSKLITFSHIANMLGKHQTLLWKINNKALFAAREIVKKKRSIFFMFNPAEHFMLWYVCLRREKVTTFAGKRILWNLMFESFFVQDKMYQKVTKVLSFL